MIDFDEQDLLAHAERAGFSELHLELRLDVTQVEPVPWDVFVNSSFNPLLPTLVGAMGEVLSEPEAAAFESHLRPLVEAGTGRQPMAGAFLWALKEP
jgi:hypothetical protein